MNEKRASIRFIERCYKLYEQKMYHVAYCILRDEGLAEDAVQEAFLKLMKSNVDFKNVKSDECKQYIITIIKHASIDIYNRKKREQELIFFSDENSDFDRSKPEALDEQQQQIREVMDKLPAKYYSVVNCMVVKELSVKETAKELSAKGKVSLGVQALDGLRHDVSSGVADNMQFLVLRALVHMAVFVDDLHSGSPFDES